MPRVPQWTAFSAACHISNGDAVGVGVGPAGVAVGVGSAVGEGVGVAEAGTIVGGRCGSGVGVAVTTMTSAGGGSLRVEEASEVSHRADGRHED